MNIKIICVGKLKEKYWKQGIAEYSKRLGKFCKFEIVDSVSCLIVQELVHASAT